mgnify:CR=1 FL=1
MCEYCEKGKHISKFSTPRETNCLYIRDGNELVTIMSYGYMYCRIKYCPMCGKKLEE